MLYAALVLSAVVFARHAPVGERCPAFTLAVALAANHLVCALAGEPVYLHHALRMEAPELWALVDGALALTGLALSFRMRANWWLGWLVWAAATGQIALHLLWIAGVLPEGIYTCMLDRGLEAMIAGFFIIGGKGVADHLGSAWDRTMRWVHRLACPAGRVLAKVVPS